MRILWTLVALLIVSWPAQAQVTPPAASAVSATLPPPVNSLTLGRMAVDFQYMDSTRQHYYFFDAPTTALRLSGNRTSLTVTYGKQEADTTTGFPAFNMIGAAFQTGGNNYFIQASGNQPLSVWIPVRFDLAYTNVAKDGFGDAVKPNLAHLHFLRGALAAGVGGSFRTPRAIPVLRDRVVVQAHLLRGAGTAVNVSQMPLRFGLSQLSELHLEARLEHVANSKMGVTVGYTLQARNWSNEAPGSVYDVLDVLFNGGELGQSSSQGMFHIGVNWEISPVQ